MRVPSAGSSCSDRQDPQRGAARKTLGEDKLRVYGKQGRLLKSPKISRPRASVVGS